MFEVASLLIVLLMSLIITRVATVALALTGMTQQAARFQARSALTGSGFTTSESERVVNHPVRRRIIMSLMLIGNTGLVLVASLLIVLLAGGEGGLSERSVEIGAALAGLLLLYVAARSAWLERALGRFIERVLARHTDLAERDFASLLQLGGEYRVVEMEVEPRDWLAGHDLAELELSREGILVLGVTRAGGEYVGAPRGETRVEPGDVVMLYGRESSLAELDRRHAGVGGQLRHHEAVVKEKSLQREDESLQREGDDSLQREGDDSLQREGDDSLQRDGRTEAAERGTVAPVDDAEPGAGTGTKP